MAKAQESDVTSKQLKIMLSFFGWTLGAYITLVIIQPIVFQDRFGVGSKIAGYSVSGRSASQAEAIVEQAWIDYSSRSITIHDQTLEASFVVKTVKSKETVLEALAAEEKAYFGLSKYLGLSHKVDVDYDEPNIEVLLSELYDSTSVVPVDAKITELDRGIVVPEKNGQRLLLAESHQMIRESLSLFAASIGVRVVELQPAVTLNNAREAVANARDSFAKPIVLSGGYKDQISANTLRKWLKLSPIAANTLVRIEPLFPENTSDYYFLDPNEVYRYVKTLEAKVTRSPVDATLSVVEGRVVVTKPAVYGQIMHTDEVIGDIQEAMKGNHQVLVAVEQKKPTVREDNLDDLGIVELVSEGWTDATGSPVNRKHNYTVGASKFNGVLIKPGEEVSFNKILGPVDASTGYLPELVILADKTVPEYGGGLCQVSSTAFRAALNAGLPIDERHNHAYPVSYYKPYGVDATIYLPRPDLRFTNDTGHHILIQTRVVGTKLYFDFFGTKKPGKSTFSGNQNAAGAVDTVEKVTPTLSDQGARGKNSFTAVFYRHIYDATGSLTDNDKFTSKYDSPDKYPH